MYVQDYQSCHKKDNDPSNDNRGASLVAQLVKNLPAMQETVV